MRKLWALLLLFTILSSSLALVPTTTRAQPAKWTFMVYMGGDSSLESFGIDDFLEMASIGSTADVNIVVQFDRIPLYSSEDDDWTTAKRYLVQKNMRPNIASALDDLGEINMGDPQTLVNFTNWGMSYSAERYALILWGHGRGWQGVVQDSTSGSDYLELDELKWAFETILANNSGKKIDLLGADACRMTTEMDYQLKDYVNFFVGSQKDEPEPGWPYDSVLHNLTSDPDMGPAELGRTIADAYVESYQDNTGLAVALSVIDASRLEYLGEEVRRFVDQARSALPMFVDMFKSARLGTEKYEGDSVYDMYDLFYRIEQSFAASSPPPRRLMSQLDSSEEAVTSTVYYERHWDNPVASVRTTYAHGLSVWYPLGIVYSSYHDLDFNNATGWDDYLLDFKAAVNGEVPDPEVSLQIDMTFFDTNSNGQNDTIQLELTSPQNATLEIDVYYYYYPPQTSPISLFLPASVPRFENITLSEETFTDLDFYLMNETRVWMNVSFFRNVLGAGYSISGFVQDSSGADLIGATVTVENLNSGEKVVVESDSSGYLAEVSPANTTDTIRITVEYNDWSATTTIEIEYPSEGEVINFVLGPEGLSSSDLILVWGMVILVIFLGITVAVLIRFLRMQKKEPVEKSGEEILKELKLE